MSPSTPILAPTSKVVIVGAGCFGLSTAYHLLQRGFTSVTVLERSAVLPAPDAASTDMNKVVRSSYSDRFYSELAREAIAEWKNEAAWGDCYQESGVLVLGSASASYADKAYANDIALGARIDTLASPDAIRAVFPSTVKTASFDGLSGYVNHDGGWAQASKSMSILLEKVIAFEGASVIPGKAVTGLLRKADGEAGKERTVGVKCDDGTEYDAELVVLAAGSWMASTFPELDLQEKCVATGQCVAFIELTDDEVEAYKDCPVCLDFVSGFYAFPPNKEKKIKFAIHSAGLTHAAPGSQSSVSSPRTVLSDGEDGLRIPKEALQKMREHLRTIYPDLADKAFSGTRLCWYTDAPDDDWVIGYHPTDSGIMLATAGCGHAFKFLPNVGRLVADAIQGTMDSALAKKFALDRPLPQRNNAYTSGLYRFGQLPGKLELDNLCTPQDLLP
ncbi:hypothetical protein EIP91_003914 [Steccherinum ochraceum]|uniref:FAD dependent oxidoreductase domain-containing protein n=1 Tax=Steccherinum ochraceum TaxID=92696 RepID=A0A4V2MW19_9APHY|nr:hypothetical protein EIP91_003914 [Steccherinum ochraceum]